MRNYLATTTLLALCTLGCTLFPGSTYAQSVLELEVSPPTAYVRVQPGSQARHTITLENTGTTQLSITPRVVDFQTDGKTGTPVLQEFTSFPYLELGGQLSANGVFDPVVIPGGKRAQLTLVFSVPATAPEKEWPLTVLFETSPSQEFQVAQSGTAVQASVGSNVIVLVSHAGTLPQQLEITSLHTPRVIDSFRPISFSPELKNPHFAAVVASGSAVVRNWQNQVVATLPIHPTAVLGFSSREVLAAQERSPDNVVSTPFSYDQPVLLGPHTVELTLTDAAGTQYATQSATVIALPLLILAGSAGVLIAGATYLVLKRRGLQY